MSSDDFGQVTNGAFSQAEQHMGVELYQQQVEQAKQGVENMKAYREGITAKWSVRKDASRRKNTLTLVFSVYMLLFLPAILIWLYRLVL